MATIRTSIVIPAYNEAKRLPPTLEVLASEAATSALYPLEIKEVIVVDDGSMDNTSQVAEKLRERLPQLVVIRSPQNRGKGNAVRIGMTQATQEWILIADADMSTPWTEGVKLANACIEQDADIAIASRDLDRSLIRQHQSVLRENLGRLFNFFLRQITGLPFKDTQCGFKLVRREAVQSFLRELTLDNFAWDVEFLYLAHKYGLRILEIPALWEHKEDSRVNVARDGIKMAGSVVKIRFQHLISKIPHPFFRSKYLK